MINKTKLVPMGKLLNLIEAAGFKLEYYFDDLVFIDNTSLLFRFDLEDYETIYLHFNIKCVAEVQKRLCSFFVEQANSEGLFLRVSESFRFDEGNDEIKIVFNS